MDFSDDEDETVLHNVSNYHFVDDKDEPVSFSELPVQWNDIKSLDDKKKQIFLRGTTDNGLQNIYKQVMAWKFDLAVPKPEIYVLSMENKWIKLQKPRKSFEDIIRTILVTVNCLHFVKKHPETSERSLWDHLSKVFSLYEPRPSENDLVDHINLIGEAANRDDVLAKSKFLVTLPDGKLTRKKTFNEDVECALRPGFIIDDVIEEDESDEESDLFDTVCAICDNGGELLCCEGRCLRSFHATVEAGAESMCESLGLSNEQVEAMQNFFCKNCQYMQHQCFACGALGSSDKSSGAEVFACVSGTCGQFYHPRCMAKLISRNSNVDATELQERIAAGEPFTCPLHKCCVCKQGENKIDTDLQFAVCRRCPKAYHRKCLPRKIAFEDLEDEDIIQRAWEDLIPNRILIYCLQHEIDDEIGTPERNHIKFPYDVQKKKKQGSDLPLSGGTAAHSQKLLASGSEHFKRPVEKEKPLKGAEKKSSSVKQCDSSCKSEGRLFGHDGSKKQKVIDTSRKRLKKSYSTRSGNSVASESRPSWGGRLDDLMSQSTKPVNFGNEDTKDSEHEQMQTSEPTVEDKNSSVPLDVDSKERILDIVKDSVSSITMEDIMAKYKVSTTHSHSSKYVVDKAITLGKVEGSVEGVRAALLNLERGGSIEDAKAVCEPRLLNHITKWKSKLKVYLAPFLHGMRYTSFGRHFTQVDKLKAIVDRLHYYVQDGDMIVDFCCGANDFSWLMKEKLDEMGKKCSYKNYDILQARNNFNFEERDWFSVQPEELSPGSHLIVGLNPPFGVNATLANKFVDKALQFKPKLLILICPRETERLDKKNPPYDLVWEDDELLAGRSFYLPGSIDVNDKQMEDWNLTAPLLNLWSDPNWTAKHKAIAEQRGHLHRVQKALHVKEHHHEVPSTSVLVGNHDLLGETLMQGDDHVGLNSEPEELRDKGIRANASIKGALSSDNIELEFQKNHGTGKSQANEISRKKSSFKRKRGNGSDEMSLDSRHNHRHSLPVHSPAHLVGGQVSEVHSSEPKKQSCVDGQDCYQNFEQRIVSRSHFHTGYVESFNDDAAGSNGLNNEEPYSTQRWPHASSSPRPDCGVRKSDKQYMGYTGESTDSHVYRSYINEMDAREQDTRPQIRLYEQQDFDPSSQGSSYSMGQGPSYSTSYGNIGSVADSFQNRMNASATQRYDPRLDELNHARVNSMSAEAESLGGRFNLYNPPQPGYRIDSLGFAPGPCRSFSQHNSSGWLDE